MTLGRGGGAALGEPARESAGRRGRRRPEGRAAAGGEPAALEAEAPSAESPRGRWGLRLRLRAWDWVTGSRGLGDPGTGVGESVSGGSAARSLETLENLIYTHVFGPTCQRVCGFAGSGIKF